MTRPTVLIGLLALLIAVLTTWLSREQESEGSAPHALAPNVPDYYLNDVQATSMGPGGLPQRRLSAAHMAHYPNDDRVTLQQPQLELFHTGSVRWQVQAQRGLLSDAGQRLALSDGVDMRRLDDSALQLHTDHMELFPARHLVRTDAAVTLTRERPRGQLQAVGMELDTARGRLTLQSQVRGSYEPTQP